MKKIFYSAIALIAAVVVFNSCYYDKEAILYPTSTSTCDTTSAATFSATVMPILNANCNICHGGTATSGAGIKLDTYTTVLTQVNNGKLIGTMSHASGYIAMPQGGGKVSDCDIAKIQKWINAGKLNN